MADVDFGSCWSCLTGLTFPSTQASGFRVVAEAIARRWQTPRGGLINDPDYGFSILDYLQGDLAKADLARIASGASAEAEKDERVLSCDAEVDFSLGTLTVKATVNTAAGPFPLVLAVNQLTVALLQPS